MNKAMKALYAQINVLFEEVETLKAKRKANPEDTDSDRLTAIGKEMIALMEQIDVEREKYRNLPFWRQLFTR